MKPVRPSASRVAIIGMILLAIAGVIAVKFHWCPATDLVSTGATSAVSRNPSILAGGSQTFTPDIKSVDVSGVTQPADELAQQVQPKGAIPNEAILTFASTAAMSDFLKRAASQGLIVKGRLDSLRSVRVAFDSLDKLRRELDDHAGDYAGIGANFPVQPPGIPPKEQRNGGGDVQFGDALLSAIGAGPEINRSQWGKGVTVAVLDSGVTAHPAFSDGQVTHVDLVNDGLPFEGHGTAIASLIVGNVQGAQGVSPAAKILDVRIAGAGGSDSFLLARGIELALDRGAQIINISMGSYGDSPVVAQAIHDALQRGVVVVASAGNDSAAVKDWPAAYPGVISVSGVDAAGRLAYFSNSGNPTLAAPGVGVPSAYAQGNKPYMAIGDGTSQAAALVSGAAAAILSQGGNVFTTLSKSALSIPANKQQAGAGMLHLPVSR
ncbi:MAG: S8 family serine peptidase [Verrucomicrobia bacterium]|nr:S8 family serine peptidase [Verrucomicrobiota bacterium]